MLEFACVLSLLPHRIVANRRRNALRVQDRVRTGRLGAHRRRLSAANIGSDHVNLGHGEYAVHDRGSLLLTILLTAVFTSRTEIISRDPTAAVFFNLFRWVFPTEFYVLRRIFTRPDRFLLSPHGFITFLRCPQMPISMSRQCLHGL